MQVFYVKATPSQALTGP